jgi:O-antigen/teichoic acid export membrane protein
MSLRRHTLWNIVGIAAPFLIGVVTIPYLIRSIGVEAFGVLTLIWALIGYFSLFDFGLGRAITQQVSEVRSLGNVQEIPSLVKTGLLLTFLTGCFGGLLLACLSDRLANDWLKVTPDLVEATAYGLMIAAIGIPLTTMTSGLRGVLEAYDDFKTVNILRMLLGTANFVLPVICIWTLGTSLIWMILSLVVARAIVMVMHWRLVHKSCPIIGESKSFTRDKLRKLLPFGIWMSVSNIVSPLMVSADRFAISSTLGASIVAFYTVPFEMLIRILIIPSALASASFPRLARELSNNTLEAKRLYKKSLYFIALVLFGLCLFTALGSYKLLDLWLGSEFAEQGWMIVCILSIGIFFNGIAHVPFGLIQAAGDARTTAQLHIAEFILYVPLLLIGLKTWGILGAPIAWTIRVFIDLVALLYFAKRVFQKTS